MKKAVFSALLVFMVSMLFGDNMTSAGYMLLDSFPEVSAKGSACGAAIYGISSYSENPASIASIENFSWEAMHIVLPLSMYSEKISIARSFDFGSLGASFSYFDFGQITSIGIDTNLGPVFTSDTIQPAALYGSIAYAKKFESFSIGMAVKGVNENITGAPWYAVSADMGFIFESIGFDNLDFGASVLNLSADDGGFSLPLCVKSALSYNIKSKVKDQLKLTAAVEYLVKEDAVKGGAGFDYAFFDDLMIRAGFTAGNKEKLKFSAGLGLRAMGLNLGYAFVPDPVTGDTHKLSLSGSFGKADEEPEKPEGKGGESYAEYKKSGDYYFENKQYRQALKYYEYINLIYWKDVEDSTEKEKISFYQKLGICYYNIRDNRRALQYFERAFYFDKENEILRHWIKLLK